MKVFQVNPIMFNYDNKTSRNNVYINNIVFRGKISDEMTLYNKSDEIDKKIKRILEQAIEQKRELIHADIAKELKLNDSATRHRILGNSELRELWGKVLHRKPIKKKTTAIVHLKNTTAVNELIIKIKSYIENAIETGTPITYSDIAKDFGITRDVLKGKFKRNSELSDLWEKCNHRTRTNKSIKSHKNLKEILQKCVDNNEIIDTHEMSKRSGLSEQACVSRISRDNELTKLWKQIKKLKSDNKTNVIENIKKALTECINKSLPMKIDRIAEQANLSVRACKHKIEGNPVLFGLWTSGIHRRDKTSTRKEAEKINQDIKKVLEEANKNGEYLRIEDISKLVGVKFEICYGRIKRYPDLCAIWQENNKLISEKSKNINLKIKKEIKKALSQKRALSFSELSAITGFSQSTCSGRIYENDSLRSLWDEMQKTSKAAFIENLKQIFSQAIENKEKITYEILKQKYGVTSDVLIIRLHENPELLELWDKVKQISLQPTKEKPISNKFKIADILQKAIDEKQTIYQKDIAQEVGINQGACKERIRKTPLLKDLWQKVEHKKISASSEALNNQIRNILEQAIKNKQIISINDIAKSVGSSKILIRCRFNRNNDLSALWTTLRENRVDLIKQFALLKIQKVPNQEIQKNLELNDKNFNEILDEYNQINRMILSHSNKNISKEEYIRWATLTKREFELAVTKLFENMGYKTGVTRYSADGGVDVLAEKDGRKTYIECVHNLEAPVRANEVLELQGCKHYFNADNVILVASSGTRGCKEIIKNINQNSNNSYKVMKLEDIINLAKEHNFDFDRIKSVKNVNPQKFDEIQRKGWLFKKSKDVTESERKEWENLSEKDFINRVIKIFEKQNYNISKVENAILKNGYIMEKDGEKTILQYIPQSTLRQAQAIRILYGAKDIFGCKNTIAFGLNSVTFAVKDFINTINRHFGKDSIKLLSLEKLITMCKRV